MKRTEEQITADELLEAAIETCRKAYGQGNGEMGEWIVLYDDQMIDGEGEISNSYGILMKGGSMATNRACGLMDIASFDMKMGQRSADSA